MQSTVVFWGTQRGQGRSHLKGPMGPGVGEAFPRGGRSQPAVTEV